jgi:hypothetical protein
MCFRESVARAGAQDDYQEDEKHKCNCGGARSRAFNAASLTCNWISHIVHHLAFIMTIRHDLAYVRMDIRSVHLPILAKNRLKHIHSASG